MYYIRCWSFSFFIHKAIGTALAPAPRSLEYITSLLIRSLLLLSIVLLHRNKINLRLFNTKTVNKNNESQTSSEQFMYSQKN